MLTERINKRLTVDRCKDIEGWKYYNHAAVPTCAPHEIPNLKPIHDGSIWKICGKPLLARWTEDFDCKYETEWWYCVLDNPFDITKLKSNKRYKINKGNKYFDVVEIEPLNYIEELIKVQVAAFSGYPKKYRPKVDRRDFIDYLKRHSEEVKYRKSIFYGAFFKDNNKLCGYHIVTVEDGYRSCNVLKSDPKYEKYQINAALVYKWVTDSEQLISDGGYISNGTRTIYHETAFQDYLEYYFGFRKAYCTLNIEYRKLVRIAVKILFPFRRLIAKLDYIGFIHQVSAVLKMEEYARSFRKRSI